MVLLHSKELEKLSFVDRALLGLIKARNSSKQRVEALRGRSMTDIRKPDERRGSAVSSKKTGRCSSKLDQWNFEENEQNESYPRQQIVRYQEIGQEDLFRHSEGTAKPISKLKKAFAVINWSLSWQGFIPR